MQFRYIFCLQDKTMIRRLPFFHSYANVLRFTAMKDIPKSHPIGSWARITWLSLALLWCRLEKLFKVVFNTCGCIKVTQADIINKSAKSRVAMTSSILKPNPGRQMNIPLPAILGPLEHLP